VFHRVTLRATDRDASERFYETVLATLGIERGGWSDFAVEQADSERPATRGLHIGFVAPSRAEVDEFWRIGTAAGYQDDGAPGPRPQYGGDYYGAFLLDPDGNSAEAVHFEGVRRDGLVDHVWIRVADVGVSKRFYETIAPRAGFRLGTDAPERAQFRGASGSFSVLTGTQTQHVEMAFAASEPGELVDPDGNLVKLVAL
jgi:catechol 2,3-dioxygenase-like lactoylglutathione lyase family enzyme